MLGRPTNTEIDEAKITHDERMKKIAPVDHDGVTETVAHSLEVQTGEFGPIGKDHQSISVFSGRVRIVSVRRSGWGGISNLARSMAAGS